MRMTKIAEYEQEAFINKESEELNLLICKLLIQRVYDSTSDAKLHFFKDLLGVLKDICVE
jgi:hypothetical protein